MPLWHQAAMKTRLAISIGRTPPAALIACAMNVLRRRLPELKRIDELSGTRVAVRATDTPWRLVFEITPRGVRPALGDAANVEFAATLADLFSIATRREDPDALFFQRRLCVEGETQTGLHLKNILDSVPGAPPEWLRALLPKRTPSSLTEMLVKAAHISLHGAHALLLRRQRAYAAPVQTSRATRISVAVAPRQKWSGKKRGG